jgi:dienelactone hydrolase
MNARLFMGMILSCCPIFSSPDCLEAQETRLSKVLAEGESPSDTRLGPLRNLRDGYHPWTPPETKTEWEETADQIRTQLRVSNGLVPARSKTELNAVVHGEIHRGDYIVQKVFFESMPGHYVTGNLYRSADVEGQVPGILCPHGHWSNGRFYDAGEKNGLQQIAQGAEKYLSGARYPLQARMVHLARMGCIVFHYDMVGYVDSTIVDHRRAFNDVKSGLWLINSMGLQTWNSMRALDFLLSQPNVDPDRIGVTGASGGGTQTFMLSALDDRVDVAFPAVMVSTGMQGGCVCENADYLRQGINNIAIAALFAPKPLGMSGADDWTKEIETKGLPELKQVYSMYDSADKVYAEAHPEFKHNYNYVSRAIMYRWMAEHLNLPDDVPLVETDFWPVSPEELSVFDEEHPLPANAKSAEELRDDTIRMLQRANAQALKAAETDLPAYRKSMQPVLQVLLDAGIPAPEEVEIRTEEKTLRPNYAALEGTIGRQGRQEAVPFLLIKPKNPNGETVLWFDEAGKSMLLSGGNAVSPTISRLLQAGYTVASADLFLTGEFEHPEWGNAIPVDETYSGYTFGYNKTTIAQRVHDLLTTVAAVQKETGDKKLHLVGTGDAGIWCLLAGALLEAPVNSMIVNLGGFSFEEISQTSDPNYLPGALRYGNIGGLGMLARAKQLIVGGIAEDSPTAGQLKRGQTARDGKLILSANDLNPLQIVTRLLGQ